MRQALLLTCFLHLGGAVSLPAQQHSAPFVRWELSGDSTTATHRWADSGSRRDYRYEGLALGGLTLGVLGAWVGSQISGPCPLEPGIRCESDKVGQAVGLGLVSAAIGGGVGYLVGRISPKKPPSLDPAP